MLLVLTHKKVSSILKIIGRIILVIILIAILLALFGYIGTYLRTLKQSIVGDPSQTDTYSTGSLATAPYVTVGNTIIPVEVARDYASIQKGLSGRASLDPNSGMLFLFEKPSIYRFWMPDMHFPIDLFWINDDRVIGIEENMSADFNPANPRYYSPSAPAQYVLEVNAGIARRNNIRLGDRVIFSNIR